MAISDDIHDNLCQCNPFQLELNDINRHVNCYAVDLIKSLTHNLASSV